MPLKTEHDLPANARSNYLKALSAMELRNFAYAITLLQAVLKETPEFLDGRKLLRKSEVQHTKGKKSFFSGLSGAAMKGGSLVKKDPVAAIELAEKTLETDPYSSSGNHLLKDAAMAAEFPEIATFALEILAEGSPQDIKVLHELGQHYSDIGQAERAVNVYNKILAIQPNDLQATKKGKDASARASMQTGGWETAKDYRDLIKDKDVAVSLEQQGRVVRSDEMIDQQIGELYARAEKEPDNIDVARKIAALFEQKGEFESAIWWYGKSSELSKGADPGLARKAADLEQKVLDRDIAAREEWLSAAGEEHEDSERVRGELDELQKRRAETLIGDARRRVERNPTDLQLRFELGAQLLATGNVGEAIPELQKARQNPNARLRAMDLLGDCYIQKGMLDLARKTYEDASGEIVGMDDTKKRLIYKLGIVHEKMGEQEKSLDCMKQIYEVDYGYKDVAKRVESSYTA